jgi:predicted 2-oxoglutarate/Fe(II)-dependent dioxygenase YbiX
MTSITAAFAEALSTVRRPSAFHVAGTEQMLAPGLAVEGVGPVALPLLPIQAEQLIAAAERAPYGRGTDTLTDIGVRRTWQIAPERVRIAGKHWPATIQAIVTRVADGLGVADPVEASLYKLLIYDQGSFFVPHRDTEKVPGMFATLVLVLPSVSQGGELIVRHKDREVSLPLHCPEPSDVAFAAFYADCVHEVRPVTAGYRLVLVYNLVRRGRGRLPSAPDYAAQENEVVTALEQWAEALRSPGNDEPENDEPENDEPENDEPEKLIFPLEHAYSPAELGFGSLKGADAGVAQVVVAAASRAGCDVHLALIAIEESGSAEYNGDYRRSGRGRYSDDDEDDEDDNFEVVEISDRDAIASDWRRPDGEPSPLTDIPVEEEEFSPPLSFEDLEPDEQHFHEATGNEGASFERTYRRAALILWPSERLLAVINQGGLPVTLPFLADLAERWEATGDTSIRDQAGALSEYMTSSWPTHEWYPHQDSGEPTDAGQFLDLLLRLRDASMAEAFLTVLTARHGFDRGDCAAIAAALRVLPPDRASVLAGNMVEASAKSALGSCASLSAHLSATDPARATAAARILVAALPGDPALVAPAMTWHRTPAMRPDVIVDLLTALGRIDATLAAVSTDHILDWPATYDFDTVLVPAMRALLDSSETRGQPAVQRLRAACAGHLDRRIALPLEAPRDWRRDNKLGCNCKDCLALATHLGDATQRVWIFAAAEPRRRHVEATIRSAHSDLDTATEKRGSPHRLVCTKNQASYERRCVQRTNDLAERDRLKA